MDEMGRILTTLTVINRADQAMAKRGLLNGTAKRGCPSHGVSNAASRRERAAQARFKSR